MPSSADPCKHLYSVHKCTICKSLIPHSLQDETQYFHSELQESGVILTWVTTLLLLGISNRWTGFCTGTWDWNMGLECGTGLDSVWLNCYKMLHSGYRTQAIEGTDLLGYFARGVFPQAPSLRSKVTYIFNNELHPWS